MAGKRSKTDDWPKWVLTDPVDGEAKRLVSVQGTGKRTSVWIGPRNDERANSADLTLEGKLLKSFAAGLIRAIYGKG